MKLKQALDILTLLKIKLGGGGGTDTNFLSAPGAIVFNLFYAYFITYNNY